jgi:SAM-dependent methyltransferase
MFGGSTRFKAAGETWVRYFRRTCGLEPDERILDVGCGVGRVALPLARYLTPQGGYEGLDIVPARIEWCTENITPRWPNFRFQRADIFNEMFNPQGELRAKQFKLPYPDEQFDFAFLISVFTHMLPDDVEHYLAEIKRVLKIGGRCLISFLLLNDESLGLLEEGKAKPDQELEHDFGHYRLATTDFPEALVAYREDFVLDLYNRVGLQVRKPIQYGRWAGRTTPGAPVQDCILAYHTGGSTDQLEGGFSTDDGRAEQPPRTDAPSRTTSSSAQRGRSRRNGKDMSEYDVRKQKELEHFRVETQHRKMPTVNSYWLEHYLRPKLRAVGFDTLNSVYLNAVAPLCESTPGELIEVVSVGAGACEHEVRLATYLGDKGITNFRIDCVDISADALDRGRKAAEDAGVRERLGFVEADINEWSIDRHYSVCLAIQSLHHFLELETVFEKIRQAITPGGLFVISDMIGRNGHRRWPEALPYIQEVWTDMPDRYKYHRRLKRFDAEFVDRDWSEKTFEGIRAQDILPLLMRSFHFEVFVAVRNVADPFLSRAYGPNLDVERGEDRALIERVADLDERLIDAGVVKPTRLIAWLRTEPVAKLRCYRHWTPEHCVRPTEVENGSDSSPQQELTTSRRKQSERKKIALYGDYHAQALARMLQNASSFRRKFSLARSEGAHSVSQKRHGKFLRDVVPELDVLIHQPISDDYRGTDIFGADNVKRRIRPEAMTISFPRLQFFGYQPTSYLCKNITPEVDRFCKEQFGPAGRELLHYGQVMSSYLRGRDVSEAIYAFDEGEADDAARVILRTEQTLEHMSNVEKEFHVDIPMSGFIYDNFAERLLFHTPRHARSEVLVGIVERILDFLSLEVTNEEIEGMRRLAPLAFVEYPLQAYVVRALNLRFAAPAEFASRTIVMSKAEMIERYYALYDLFNAEMWETMSGKFPRLVSRLGSSRAASSSPG